MSKKTYNCPTSSRHVNVNTDEVTEVRRAIAVCSAAEHIVEHDGIPSRQPTLAERMQAEESIEENQEPSDWVEEWESEFEQVCDQLDTAAYLATLVHPMDRK